MIEDIAIHSAYFIEIDVPDVGASYFSDYHKPYDIDGNTYTPAGSLLSISPSKSELRASKQEVNVSISGIPAANIALANQTNIRGSTIKIYRGFFNPVTGNELIGLDNNPGLRFQGIVNTVNFKEDYDVVSRTSTFTLSFICSSKLSYYKSNVTGERTNNFDREKFFPSDLAMSRVSTVKNANYNFGTPSKATIIGLK